MVKLNRIIPFPRVDKKVEAVQEEILGKDNSVRRTCLKVAKLGEEINYEREEVRTKQSDKKTNFLPFVLETFFTEIF